MTLFILNEGKKKIRMDQKGRKHKLKARKAYTSIQKKAETDFSEGD